MTDLAQIDRIVTEVDELDERGKIIFFQKIKKLFDDFDEKSNDEVPIESAFGLWKNRNITKETLRRKAWMKN
jgi:hypothetical protein